MVMASPHPTPTLSRPSATPHPLQGQKAGGRERSVQSGLEARGPPEGPEQQETPKRGPQAHQPPPTKVSPEAILLCVGTES